MYRFDLGAYRRRIATRSEKAQRCFDRGLNWCYGFNQDEAIRHFEDALDHDPACAMAEWGIAYAAGPFYNLTWKEFGEAEADTATRRCFEHIERARSKATAGPAVERRLIEALGFRVQQPRRVSLAEFARWDDEYADAMRRVYRDHPADHDVMALLVEALMMRTVRKLWNLKTGAPAPGSDALEALGICDRSIALADRAGHAQHPAILHLHIHLLEMSSMPERAMRSADLLGAMCPDAGHMNHMPAHIYVLCGDYERAKLASEKAVRANDLYLAEADPTTYYILGCCHDLHLLMFAALFLGQLGPARRAADAVRTLVTRDLVSLPDRPKLTQTVEGYVAMKTHVLVRFGCWQEIIDEPPVDEPELYVMTAALQHYAKGVACAALRRFDEARREREHFHRQVARIPPERRFLSNPTRASMAVGAALLDGELAYHQGQHDEAFAHLRRAVVLDDDLSYTEPWAWMHPPRHALAALLLDQNRVVEAEQVYRDDLGLSGTVQRCSQHPNNVWSLHGLVECLQRRGEAVERPALERRLAEASAKADVPIRSSCACRMGPFSSLPCCH